MTADHEYVLDGDHFIRTRARRCVSCEGPPQDHNGQFEEE